MYVAYSLVMHFAVLRNMEKKSCIRIIPRFNRRFLVPRNTRFKIFAKVHPDVFWVILLTDRQTYKQTETEAKSDWSW